MSGDEMRALLEEAKALLERLTWANAENYRPPDYETATKATSVIDRLTAALAQPAAERPGCVGNDPFCRYRDPPAAREKDGYERTGYYHLKPAAPEAGKVRHTVNLPAIGAIMPEEGGRFAGLVFGDDGLPSHLLILHDEAKGAVKWKTAIAWAEKLQADDHQDFRLPDRRDAAVLWANNHLLQIEADWYWTPEPYAGNEASDWIQAFGNGYQIYDLKGYGYRARAVRRVPL